MKYRSPKKGEIGYRTESQIYILSHKPVTEVANILKSRNLKQRKQGEKTYKWPLQICLDVNLTIDRKMLNHRNIWMMKNQCFKFTC
jgi:hypothetical protein